MNTPLFDSIFKDIVTNTNRPHQIAETTKAIKDATLELHAKDFFDLDINTVLLQTTSAPKTLMEFMIPANTLIRKIKSICPVDNSGKLGNPLLDKAIGSRFNDLTNLGYSGWYTNIGKKLTISASTPVSTFQIAYYTMPRVIPAEYESWIAQTYPYMVTDLASAKCFHQNGLEAEARLYLSRVGNQELRDSHVHVLIAEHSDKN
jgi:hypothetical protein